MSHSFRRRGRTSKASRNGATRDSVALPIRERPTRLRRQVDRMASTSRPLRADARRNRDKILSSARELFARSGPQAQMEEVAEHAGVGLGTLYRRFPTKEALITAMVQERFESFVAIARAAEEVDDPFQSLVTVMRGHAQAAEDDAVFQLAMMQLDTFYWEGIEQDQASVGESVTRILNRAKAANAVRDDLTFDDYTMLMGSITATMHFRYSDAGWERHLTLILEGLRQR